MTAEYPRVRPEDIGWLTEVQMIEVDRVMVEDLQIELIQMMENAGRNLAQLIIDRLSPRSVTVLAGSGGNGGGGLVAARHLANRGVEVTVTLSTSPDALSQVAAHQFEILQRMGVPEHSEPRPAGVVIDALIGYSLRGAPRGRVAGLIEGADALGGRIVALDNPSGINVTDGAVPGSAVTADMTMTLALPKVGLRNADRVGDLFLADISVPPSVYGAMGVGPVPDFTTSPIISVLAAGSGSGPR